MASRKRKTTRSTARTRKKPAQSRSSRLSVLAFSGLCVFAAAGWWFNPGTDSAASTQNSASRTAVTQNSTTQTASHRTPATTQSRVRHESPTTMPRSVPVPTNNAIKGSTANGNNNVASANAPRAAITPPPPIQKQPPLPPRQVQTTANSANVVFAGQDMHIYQQASFSSAKGAVVRKGQEMRSYRRENGWHFVVVPQTDIIGWVPEQQLQTAQRAGQSQHGLLDLLRTGSTGR